MQEQNGDRLRALLDRRGGGGAHRVLVERDQHLALRVHALADLVAQVALDQRLMAAEEEVIGFRPVDAADLVDVTEALRGDERTACAGALQNGVDRDRRAVQEQPRRPEPGARLRDPVLDPRDQPRRRGQRLAEPQLPVASSNAATSVKVPPTSADSRIRLNSIVLKRKLRQACRRRRRYQPRPCAATPAISLPPAAALARSTGMTSPANRPIDRRLSSSVRSPKANCPTR